MQGVVDRLREWVVPEELPGERRLEFGIAQRTLDLVDVVDVALALVGHVVKRRYAAVNAEDLRVHNGRQRQSVERGVHLFPDLLAQLIAELALALTCYSIINIFLVYIGREK